MELKYSIPLALFVFLIVDTFIRPPFGFMFFRKILGAGVHHDVSAPVCGWDFEASWQIGLMKNGRSPWEWENDEHGHESLGINTPQPIVTCATLNNSPPSSFVADPFLFMVSDTKWYLFYEQKNLVRFIGEIGVAFSSDKGETWAHRGTALEEDFHLSYPHIHFDRIRNVYQMIPETVHVKEVRVYETSAAKFPFGWKVAHTPLKGERFVDTGATWYEGNFWIFTTVDSSLKLYYAPTLTGTWTEHPSSPVVRHNRSIGRSGGPPVVYKGHIYRFAQDDSTFYGEGVHVFRVNVLTFKNYQEQHLKYIKPSKEHMWSRERFHHLDAHELADGSWMAVFDADPHPDDFEYYRKEGWLYRGKRVFIALLAIYFLMVISFDTNCISTANVASSRTVLKRYTAYALKSTWSLKARCTKYIQQFRNTKCDIFFRLISSFVLCFLLSLLLTNNGMTCIDKHSHDTEQCFKMFQAQSSNAENQISNEEFVIVTSASSGFMDRLSNLVGSVHYWEPEREILMYDLGLNHADKVEITQWKRVKIVPFPFESYPAHVRQLFNFAWKIILLHEALKTYPRVLYLDSGVEIRRPISNIISLLDKDGYFSAHQSNFVGNLSHPNMFTELQDIVKMNKDQADVALNNDSMIDKPFCAGGIQGLVRGQVEDILEPALQCALRQECIAPTGSGRNNHNYDQSVLSSLIYFTGKGHLCHPSDVYAEGSVSSLTVDETRCNNVELSTKRWKLPKHYSKHVDSFMVKQKLSNNIVVSSLEVLTGNKPNTGSKWQTCINACEEKQHHKSKEKCEEQCGFSDSKVNRDEIIKKNYRRAVIRFYKDYIMRYFTECVMTLDFFFFWFITFIFCIIGIFRLPENCQRLFEKSRVSYMKLPTVDFHKLRDKK